MSFNHMILKNFKTILYMYILYHYILFSSNLGNTDLNNHTQRDVSFILTL